MTKKEALTLAMNAITVETDTDREVVATIQHMIDQLSTPRKTSREALEKQYAARKEKTATARAELVAAIVPVLRTVIRGDMTAKEIYEAAKDALPTDFSAAKVQNILLREMASELVKTEAKGKANTYRLA